MTASTSPREKRSRKAIRAALEAIDEASRGRPLALALSKALEREGGLGPQERRAAAQAARGVLRELRRLDAALALAAAPAGLALASMLPEDRSLFRYLALRVSAQGEGPARALEELALPGPRRPRAIDDAALARVAERLPRADDLPAPPDPVRALALRRSVPDFLARRLAGELGLPRADRLLGALNEPPRLDLRANRLRTRRGELASRLAAEGVATSPCALSPDGLIAADRAHLFGRAHAQGLFEVQDEGSQLIALATGASAGEIVVDFCAGSGGKALALAALVGSGGRVVACDPAGHRLAQVRSRARRAGAAGVVEVAGEVPPEALSGRADAVLVDAPCSGVGSLRREVDLRWRLREDELEGFPVRQLEILKAASRFVRPGGRLVYATCSPFRAEGEAVVERFLEAAAEFAPGELRRALPPEAHPALESPFALRTWPERDGGGAFFAALLARASPRAIRAPLSAG